MDRGIPGFPVHAGSERMAWTLVSMLGRWNQDTPVLVLGQNYLCRCRTRVTVSLRQVPLHREPAGV